MVFVGAVTSGTKFQLPKVDFGELNQTKVNTPSWVAARTEVLQALETYGGFEAIYNRVGTEISEGLLGQVVPELLAQKGATELVNPKQVPYHGAWMQKKGFPYFSIQLTNLNSAAATEKYVNTIWPQGNSYFSNTVWNYAVHMQELILMIHRMIFECMGVQHQFDSFIKSLAYSMRMSKYHEDLSSNKTEIALPQHKDPNYLSIIGQHKMDGLEIEASNGEWIHISPLPNTFTVILGEALMAWSNGRLKAPVHRVKLNGSEERYSVVYSTHPSQFDDMINSPAELVDENHPLVYKPFNYYEYLKFRFSAEGEKYEDILKAYCALGETRA